MKLLFDQNLSPKLVALLGDLFPNSIHVMTVGLHAVEDREVWEYAKINNFCIVSKDSDFGDWAQVFGHPPALVWIRTGNASTEAIANKIKLQVDKINRLGKLDEPWVIVIF